MESSPKTVAKRSGKGTITSWINDKEVIGREDGPSLISHSEKGVVEKEIWLKDGEIHRAGDSPAVTIYNPYGQVQEQLYFNDSVNWKKELFFGEIKNTIQHLPGHDFRDVVTFERDGVLHNENGPAKYTQDRHFKVLYTQEWYDSGQRHRVDGPAVIGPKGKKEFWLWGNQYTEEEFLKTAKTLGDLAEEEAEDILEDASNLLDDLIAEQDKKMDLKSEPKQKKSNKSTMKDKLGKAGTRIATRTLVLGIQTLLENEMTKTIKNAKQRSAAKEGIRDFLKSDMGKAMIGMLLGAALPHAAKIEMFEKYEDKLDALAEEFMVEGLAVGGMFAVEQMAELVGPATELIKGYLESVTSEDEKVRVETTPEEKAAPASEEHEAELSTAKEELKRGGRKGHA